MKRSFAVLALVALATQAYATDDVAKAKLETAKANYASRNFQDPSTMKAADAALEAAEKEAVDSELKYEILVLRSRVIYFLGKAAQTRDEKLATFDKGTKAADRAKAVNDSYADAYYFYAINLSRWAEAKGKLNSLDKKDEIIKNLETAKTKDTQSLDSGATIDGYGPDRVLGKIYYELPGFVGGSNRKAAGYLKDAYEKAPTTALNAVYYAETLNELGKDDELKANQAKAKEILTQLLAKDANTLNPDRIPETKEEFEDARKLLKKIGN